MLQTVGGKNTVPRASAKKKGPAVGGTAEPTRVGGGVKRSPCIEGTMRASNSQPTKGFQTDGSAVTVAVQGERSCTWGRGHARAVGSIRYPMDRMTKDIRALELYRMARSVVDTQGRFVSVGVLTFKEYRLDDLSIRFWPSTTIWKFGTSAKPWSSTVHTGN